MGDYCTFEGSNCDPESFPWHYVNQSDVGNITQLGGPAIPSKIKVRFLLHAPYVGKPRLLMVIRSTDNGIYFADSHSVKEGGRWCVDAALLVGIDVSKKYDTKKDDYGNVCFKGR
jgi:hypothetical protein